VSLENTDTPRLASKCDQAVGGLVESAPKIRASEGRPVVPASDSGDRRIESVDVVRGIIIVVMALDHVRDFFGDSTANPTNLSTTTAALFFTRWITHFCAPVFFLLTGTGAYLALTRMSKGALTRFLLTRGLWLLVLDVVVIRFALQFNLDYRVTVINVLWALGWSMMVLSALVWLPLWAIAAFGVLLVAGHNAFDGSAMGGSASVLRTLLHQPGVLYRSSRSLVIISYVLIPWVGVTAIGYALGAAYRSDAAFRRRLLVGLGVVLITGFVVLRLANGYGDPAPWSTQRSGPWTLISFLNTTKYPPSLLFLLMTLGPAVLLLRVFDASIPTWLRPALIIGKVPLFFFVVHFFVIHLLAVAVSYLRYGTVSGMFQSPDLAHFPFSAPPGWALGLPLLYAVWAAVVIALFPLCRWYAGVKQRRHDWWLSYL
jgi:uncharacterized membrane protein